MNTTVRSVDLSAVSLEPAQATDRDHFHALRSSVMRPHVERIYPWDEAHERAYDDSVFNPATLQRIMYDEGWRKGVIGYINLRPADYATISLGLFCVAPEYQDRGVGAEVLERVLNSFPCKGKVVFLNVLKGNPAVRLYQRFGFEYSHSDAYSDYYRRLPIRMRPNNSLDSQ